MNRRFLALAATVLWTSAGSSFAAARQAGHRALVIAMHSDIFGPLGAEAGGPFEPLYGARSLSPAFAD